MQFSDMQIPFKKKLLSLLGASVLILIIFLASPGQNQTTCAPPTYSKVLLVGFEPFGGESLNSSSEAIDYWNNNIRASYDFTEDIVFKIIRLPVNHEQSVNFLTPILDEWNPDLILMFGMYWDNDGVRLEQFARSKDLKEETRLPIAKLKKAYEEAGIEVYVSNDAGNYVCNYLFYSVMDYLNQKGKDRVVAGFIHVPRVNQDGFSKPVLGKVVNIAVTSILGYDE